MSMIDEAQRKRHAAGSFRLAFGVSGVIAALVFIIPNVAPALNEYAFFRFPLGLFASTQGMVFCLIAVIYWASSQQDRLDRKYGLTNEL
ncbi:MAG: DUF4212 domain-containing protein [Hyphomicrobiales bacterium]|nr:DUF4212 domain-containing protein [Hyphomicrobiales bacterium]